MSHRCGAAGAIALYALASGCTLAAQQPAARFGAIGEGLSSANPTTAMVVEHRMFSVPDTPRLCAEIPRDVRLVARRPQVALQIGEALRLTRMVVTARDPSGQLLPKVPVVLEIEETEPRLFDLGPYTLEAGLLVAVAPGRARLRIRALCGDAPDDAFADVELTVSRR